MTPGAAPAAGARGTRSAGARGAGGAVARSLRRRARLPLRADAGTVLAAARGVDLARGGVQVLHDVSVEVRAGEVRALIGPNGAGKSSLLGVLTGDLEPARGTVEAAGAPLASWSTTELALRRAVMTQDVTLSFPFLVHEVVAMGRSPWHGTAAADDDDAVVAASMAATDVTHLAGRAFPTLSGGERARVALARVLAQRAQLLMLDEPTAALDLHHQEMVLALARDHARAGGAVVVVVHDVGLAAAYADRVTIVAGGRVAGDGTPEEILTAERLSAVYEHPVEVLPHPRGGAPIILPRR